MKRLGTLLGADLMALFTSLLERLVVRYPALAAVETQVTLLLAAVLPAATGAIATEAQLDALLKSTVVRGVVRRGSPPTNSRLAAPR